MEEFTIYYGTPEGKDIKIGVDCNYPKRINKQKIHDGQILEVHTCVYEVSDREQELQRQYGVRVDLVPYYVNYFKNKNADQRAKISNALLGNTCAAGNKGNPRSEETKLKIGNSASSTTPELDVLVIADRLLGMSQNKLAEKHNITRKVVRRIIRNMNE